MEQAAKRQKLLIAVCNLGQIRNQTVERLLQISQTPGFDVKVMCPVIQPLDASRNVCAMEFLNWSNDPDDAIFFLDDDILPPPDVIARLYAHGKGIVGSLSFMAKPDDRGFLVPMPVACRKGEDGKLRVVFEGKGLESVDAFGCASVLIRRKVLVDVGTRPFQYSYKPDGRLDLVADYAFMLRAKEAGHQPYVDFGTLSGHVKPVDLMEVSRTMAQMSGQ